jgi:endonuclease/exonuclease/phosphatase (EEP) superfamily protein YafD
VSAHVKKIAWFNVILAVSTATVCGVTVAGLFARWSWILELTTHFRPMYFTFLFFAAFAFLFKRKWRISMLVTIFAFANMLPLVPLYVRSMPAIGVNARIYRAVQLNVRNSNRDYKTVLDFLRSSQADFVMIEEVDDEWLAQLETLQPYYPYIKGVPSHSYFGMALLSRVPFSEACERDFAAGVPSIVADFDLDGNKLCLVGTHAPAPMDEELSAVRNYEFTSMAAFVADQPDLTMIMGDLNCTSWSPYFRDLINESGLRDSRVGFGNEPTWPTKFFPGLIAIDHCLVSDRIIVSSRRVGPYIGSDHYPIIVDFSIAPSDGND